MAPGYRSSNRRQNRSGLVDHDIFEGLPIRQWRRGLVMVDPSSIPENTISQNDIWAIELPYGMPKDSHFLPQHTQELLRAARSGRIHRRPATTIEEEVDSELINGEKLEKKDMPPLDHGFIAKVWKQIPRHLEEPDVEYLAKRRKGLITVTDKSTIFNDPTTVKTTVERVDAVGNEYIKDVHVPQEIHTEVNITSTTYQQPPSTESSTPQVKTHLPKRKGPFRKKSKLVGRGKKKLILPTTSAPSDATTGSIINSQVFDCASSERDSRSLLANMEDKEMGEDSAGNSDDEVGDEGEDAEDNEEENETSEKYDSLSAASQVVLASNTGNQAPNAIIEPAFSNNSEQGITSSSLKESDTSLFIVAPSESEVVSHTALANEQMAENLHVNKTEGNTDNVLPQTLPEIYNTQEKSEEFTSIPSSNPFYEENKHEQNSRIDCENVGMIEQVHFDHADLKSQVNTANTEAHSKEKEKDLELLSTPVAESLPFITFDQYGPLPHPSETEGNLNEKFNEEFKKDDDKNSENLETLSFEFPDFTGET